MSDKKKYPLVLMCTPSVAMRLRERLHYFYEYIEPSKIIVVGNGKVGEYIAINKVDVDFIDEDKVLEGLTYKKVESLLMKKNNDTLVKGRTGWYFQQFLKYAISLKMTGDDYLIWDADTIPTRHVNMMVGNKRIMHTSHMVHLPYAESYAKIFPQYSYDNRVSFITEHMLINCDVVKHLIKDIENNKNLVGDLFFEKIIDSIDEKNLSKSGFSEFETYGNYVFNVFPDMYECRKWRSLRAGTAFFKELNDNDVEFLAKYVDAVSFESHKKHVLASKYLAKKWIGRLLSIVYLKIVYHG